MIALHAVIFQTQQVFGLEDRLEPVQIALENWSAIWQTYSNSCAGTTRHCTVPGTSLHTNNMWRRVGFMRFASEYWLLAKLIVNRIIATHQSKQYNSHIANDALKNRSLDEDDSAPTLLGRYDETSMQQVNDLIADLQRVVL